MTKLKFQIIVQDFRTDETYPVTSIVRKQVREYLTKHLAQDIKRIFKIDVEIKITIAKNQVTVEFKDKHDKLMLDRINTLLDRYDFGSTSDGNIFLTSLIK